YDQAAQLPSVKVLGMDCHIGSQVTEPSPYLAALDRLLELVQALEAKGIALEHLDLGGGMGIRYQDEQPLDINAFAEALVQRLNGRSERLILEPGRSLVAEAGLLLTRVNTIKQNEAHKFAVVDAAMNDLLRPALYQAWQEVLPVSERPDKPEVYDIVGPVCESGDFLAKDRSLALAENDLLAIMSAGAYGLVMSSNYNTRCRAPEILVDGDTCHLIRRRETLDDLLALETPQALKAPP
ncbi:MAG: diaminopimelate decarboxylase family protein, partial [Pseudomonadales bacterium]